MKALLVAWLVAGVPPAEATMGPVRVALEVDGPRNLVFHLDCLAGLVGCSRAAFDQLWRQQLRWTEEDDTALAAYRDAHAPRVADVLAPATSADGLPLQSALGDPAAAASHDLRYDVTRPEPARDRALVHFGPRFRPWFAARSAALARTREDLVPHLVRLGPLAESVLAFYAPGPSPAAVLPALLVARPATAAERADNAVTSRATVAGNRLLVEVPEDEAAVERADMLFHEWCHLLYARRPAMLQRALAIPFTTRGASALGAWGVMDEAVAAALAQGLAQEVLHGPAEAQKRVQASGGLYAEPFIDLVGSRIVPLVRNTLQQRGTLDVAFALAYLRAADEALGDRADSLQVLLRLREVAATDASLQPVVDRFQAAFRSVRAFNNVGHPRLVGERVERLPVIILARWSELDGLAHHPGVVPTDTLDTLRSLRAMNRAVSHGSMGGGRPVLVLVGDDAEALSTLVDLLVRVDHAFTGVGGRVPRRG